MTRILNRQTVEALARKHGATVESDTIGNEIRLQVIAPPYHCWEPGLHMLVVDWRKGDREWREHAVRDVIDRIEGACGYGRPQPCDCDECKYQREQDLKPCCQKCQGTGLVGPWHTKGVCPECQGTGKQKPTAVKPISPPQHTPGPWDLFEVNAAEGDLVYCLIGPNVGPHPKMANGVAYAGTYGKRFNRFSRSRMEHAADHPRQSAEECRANARLVSAAPELLAALIALLPRAGAVDYLNPQLDPEWMAAIHAIAKVTGDPPATLIAYFQARERALAEAVPSKEVSDR